MVSIATVSIALTFDPSGGVFYLDEKLKLEKKFSVDGSVRKLLFHEERNLLVTLSSSMMVTLTSVEQDSKDTKMLMSVGDNDDGFGDGDNDDGFGDDDYDGGIVMMMMI